jgi:hypothetical protein
MKTSGVPDSLVTYALQAPSGEMDGSFSSNSESRNGSGLPGPSIATVQMSVLVPRPDTSNTSRFP